MSKPVAPKVFIIDDSAEYRALLGHHITTHWPDARVREYDPLHSGRLPDSFSGAGNDLVLLGHPAGGGDALDWLRQFRRVPIFPPVVVIGNGEERQIVEAIQAGAAEYLSKARLNHARLIDIAESLIGTETGVSLAEAGLPSLKGYQIETQLSGNEVVRQRGLCSLSVS
jgi:DNA-binding NtrC family response regulator